MGPAHPVELGSGVVAGDDGDDVAVAELVGELDLAAVDVGGDGAEADVGVNVEGGVEDGGASGEVENFPVAEEDEDAFAEEFSADGVDELVGGSDFVLPGLDRVEPGEGVLVAGGRAGAVGRVDIARGEEGFFVEPVGGHAVLGDLVHPVGADLYLDDLVLGGSPDEDVERAIAVGFREGYVVLDAGGGVAAVEVLDEGEDLIAEPDGALAPGVDGLVWRESGDV